MQIQRMTELVFALLKSERMTARSLAERFGVSTRTVYRDIDILSSSGIPILTDKGNGGGISIAEDYRLDKAVLTDAEKQNILTMLTAYHAAVNNDTTAGLLEKLSGIFKTDSSFIEVDFSDWQNDDSVQKTFDILKCCILDKCVASVAYRNAGGEEQSRELEPLKLIFKHRDWYLYAYCRRRKENRLFKLSRIQKTEKSAERFSRVCAETDIAKKLEWKGDTVNIKLQVTKAMKSRVFEEYPEQCIALTPDGDYIVEQKIPLDNWVIGYILSFGDGAKVVEPHWLREKVRDIHKRAAQM